MNWVVAPYHRSALARRTRNAAALIGFLVVVISCRTGPGSLAPPEPGPPGAVVRVDLDYSRVSEWIGQGYCSYVLQSPDTQESRPSLSREDCPWTQLIRVTPKGDVQYELVNTSDHVQIIPYDKRFFLDQRLEVRVKHDTGSTLYQVGLTPGVKRKRISYRNLTVRPGHFIRVVLPRDVLPAAAQTLGQCSVRIVECPRSFLIDDGRLVAHQGELTSPWVVIEQRAVGP